MYEGHQVFDHTRAPASESYGGSTGGGGSSPNRKPLGDLYSANNQPTARERYEEYLRSVDLKTSSQPASRSVIGYEDTRVPVPAPDLQQYEREDTTNTYSAYNASKAGGVVSSFAGGQANGGTQNNGNFIGDRSSTRLWAPPGGQSSFSISHAGQENYANADAYADADIGFGTRRRSYKQPGECIYIHTCMHTYIHTYIHIYIYTYVHTYIHTCTDDAKSARKGHISNQE